MRNTDTAPRAFEAALHSYFAVSDVRQVRLLRPRRDVRTSTRPRRWPCKPGDERARSRSRPRPIASTSARPGTVTIDDPGWRRRIVVGKSGSSTTVVWNPWVAKAKAMPDFGDDEWSGMVCVETANAMDDAVTLAPGATHVMTATLEVQAV